MSASSSSASLERVNLNLPSSARQTLRALAKTAGQPDAVYARELLVAALEHAAAEQFRRQLAASRTPARRKRDHEIATAMDRLRG